MSFFNTSEQFVPGQSAAKIKTADIHTNLKLTGVTLIDKQDTPAEGNKPAKKGYQAAEFIFENEAGETHTELFMKPVSDPSTVAPDKTSKWYDKVDGKMVSTRKATVAEHISIKNNEFLYFLLDLGDALGYDKEKIKAALGKARDFADAVNIFKKNFPAGEKSRINARILWQNNEAYGDRKASSFLKIYYKNFTMYYPFGDDMFERHVPGRPATLIIKDYDAKPENGDVLRCKYPYERPAGPATNNPMVSQDNGAGAAQSGLAAAGYGGQAADDDPF